MLGLVAAQLKHRCEAGLTSQRPVWVDVSASALMARMVLTIADWWRNWSQVGRSPERRLNTTEQLQCRANGPIRLRSRLFPLSLYVLLSGSGM